MILYLSPGACSLADHIALHEAGLEFDRVKVDLKTHTTEDGRDYRTVNPKGYVPALVMDDGQMLTENVAILSWVADQVQGRQLEGAQGRYRLLEMLAYISTEIHKAYRPLFAGGDESAKAQARETIGKRLAFLAERFETPYLLGQELSVADPYLFVMLLWAEKHQVAVSEPLKPFADRMKGRPAVKLALQHEGLA